MASYREGTILPNANVDIVAQDAGDIVIEVAGKVFPLKALTCEKTIEQTKHYGTGSHQAYQKTYGKVSYKGTFTVHSWISHSEKLMLDYMLFDVGDEGLPLEFVITVYDRVANPNLEAQGTHGTMILQMLYCTVGNTVVDIGEPGNPVGRKYDYEALRAKGKIGEYW